jgi:O-antigen/teichoic acid export membrane protein
MTTRPFNIAASAISGIRWNYLGTIGGSLCSLVVGVVLARVLGPRPFGQIVIASTIYGFVNLFVDGGFSQALIQKPDLTEETIRKTGTCQVGLGLIATAAVYFCAPWVARQFHDPSAVHVVQAMSVIIAIQSTGLVSAALLRRKMRFKAIQFAYLSSYLIGFLGIGVPLALRGAGVWSLVLAYLSQCAINSLLLRWASRHSLAPLFAFPDRSIVKFGSTIIATNAVNWGHSNLDNIAASHLGPVALGLYGRGCNFAYQPVNAVVNGLQSVLLSSSAKAQDRRPLMRDLTLAVIAIVFGLLGAAYVTFAMVPDTTIIGLYGTKWTALIPLMIPLALTMPFFGAHAILGPILCGLGRPELEFWPQALSCGFAAIAFFAAVHVSLLALAWTLLVVTLIRFAMIATFVFRLLEISWMKAIALVSKRIAFSVAFGCAAWSADHFLRLLHLGPAPRLGVLFVFCLGLLGASVWHAGDLVFGRDAIGFLLNYASHLPETYVRQLRRQTRPDGRMTLVSPQRQEQ